MSNPDHQNSDATNLVKVRECWPNPEPWLIALAELADRTSQARAASKIGYSGTTINLLFRGKYPGNLKKVADNTRGALFGDSVGCPVAGAITLDACRTYQGRKFTATSSFHTRLYRACRSGCPHSSLENTKC